MSKQILLPEAELPQQWYNVLPDLPQPLPPPIHPGTLQPIEPEQLAPLFPMSLIEQEVSPERWIQIPEPVLDIYRLYPTHPFGAGIPPRGGHRNEGEDLF